MSTASLAPKGMGFIGREQSAWHPRTRHGRCWRGVAVVALGQGGGGKQLAEYGPRGCGCEGRQLGGTF